MKILAMYLPQFHRVPENDEWWGEGFTEWTAVRQAKVYYEGQVHPRVPLNHNYYDLLNKETMVWQANLMHQYNVYGMVFYHYWFKDGKKILEKPAENLLKWKDVEMPFCFSWANQPWARSWSHLRGKLTWSSKVEASMDMDPDKAMLLEQGYGEEKEWKEHFSYLINFFKDERYIKVDGKPMFLINAPLDIPCLMKMVSCWRREATKQGLEGLYIVGTAAKVPGVFDAVLCQEPGYVLRSLPQSGYISSDKVWEKVLENEMKRGDIPIYYCGFPGFDSTPRKGKGGLALSPMSPKQFEDNMAKLIAKSRAFGNEFTFINAWNEWGEGMYLEPDELNEYGMLNAVKNALERSKTEPYFIGPKNLLEDDASNEIVLTKYRNYYITFDKWMLLLEEGKSVDNYLLNSGYQHIAIYGLGMLGQHLATQLNNTDVIIDYGIDQRGANVRKSFPVYTLKDELPQTQLVIVTVMHEYADIYNELLQRVDCEILSLDEILEAMLSYTQRD